VRNNRIVGVLIALALAALPGCRGTEESAPKVADSEVSVSYAAEMPSGLERVWVGPGFYGNRLQDWRLAQGRIECVQGAAAKPIRVLHALDVAIAPDAGSFTAAVLCGPFDVGADDGDSTRLGGFLIGAGGEGIDYRLTALAHHRPAQDGGLAVGLDARGAVRFRDNETNVAKGGWGITGALKEGEFGEVSASSRRDPSADLTPPDALRLEIEVQTTGDGFRLNAQAVDPSTGAAWSRATLDDVDPRLVEGSLALLSHLSPRGDGGGYWFDDWTAQGTKLRLHPERVFGPVLATSFTTSRGVLKLTAQMPPLGDDDSREASLEVFDRGAWRELTRTTLTADSCTFPFRVEGWPGRRDVPFRVVYELRTGSDSTLTTHFEGVIPAEPAEDEELVVAAFTGNKHFTGGIRWNGTGVWFPHTELVAAVVAHEPDLLYFSGDQIYEGDLTGAQRKPLDTAILDYLDKWNRWCWAFQDLTRRLPTIAIPDDHDVYHGNLWGAGGRHAKSQDDGGYRMPARFVQAVERTQTSHLPDPFDPRPVEQGIGVYFTSYDYGGVSFAILEDRKFKSSATPLLPEGKVVNGWFQNPDYDPATQADSPDAALLGTRQLDFLEHWSADWQPGIWFKCALSQTIFANVATLPASAGGDMVVPGLQLPGPGEYPDGDVPAADTDSNGWPQSGRNAALRAMRKSSAFHIAGDQHLGSLVHYGIDEWDDAGLALCVPSIANTWPRRWFPREGGADREEGAPKYTGAFHDGFGNKVRVHAVSNPQRSGHEPAALHDRAPGYGIVRFDKLAGSIQVECWPRWAEPGAPDEHQYPGWPATFEREDNYARVPHGYLPPLELKGLEDAVVQVRRVLADGEREVVYTRRVRGTQVELPVFEAGLYDVSVGEPAEGSLRYLLDLEPGARDETPRVLEF